MSHNTCHMCDSSHYSFCGTDHSNPSFHVNAAISAGQNSINTLYMTVCVVIGNFPAKIKVYTPYMGLKFRVYKYILYNSILANPSRYLCHTGLLAHLSFCVFVALLQCRREVALHACSLRVVSASHTILRLCA